MNLELIENSQEVQTKFTETAGGYWSGTSVNSELDTQFWEKLVPSSGNADTVHGELLRAASRIYRDMYQNGGGNLIDFVDNGHSCDHCSFYEDRDGLEDYDDDHSENCPDSWVISDYYQEMFDFLEKHLTNEGRKTLKEVKALVLQQPYDISIMFDRLVDHTIHIIQTTKNVQNVTAEV